MTIFTSLILIFFLNVYFFFFVVHNLYLRWIASDDFGAQQFWSTAIPGERSGGHTKKETYGPA